MEALTNTELAETATALLAQVDRADLRIVYAGNGWFHRLTSHAFTSGGPFKERRKQVERTIAGLHERIAREAAERPENERKQREAEARARLERAAPQMLAALKAVVGNFALWRVGGSEMEQARAAVVKAEEGEK